MRTPVYWSSALEDIPAPDYADMIFGVLPPGAPEDPIAWVKCVFSPGVVPRWIGVAMAARQALVPLLGIPRAPRGAFRVERTEGRRRSSPWTTGISTSAAGWPWTPRPGSYG